MEIRIHLLLASSDMLDKLQKWVFRAVDPARAASLKLWVDGRNVAAPSLFYRHYFGKYSSKLAELASLPYYLGWSTYSNIANAFFSSSPEISRISMPIVSFFVELGSGILDLHNVFCSFLFSLV